MPGWIISPPREDGVQNLVLVKNEPGGATQEVICEVLYVSLRGRYGE